VLGAISMPGNASAGICHPFSDFGKPISRCEDNLALSESAMNCVDDLERHIEAGKVKIQKLLAAQVEKMKKQQSDSFDRSSVSYQEVQKVLNRLIADSEQAKADVDSYISELFLPEDYDQPKITGMSTKDYLASEPCYATPETIITGSSELISTMLGDLKATNLAALEKEAKSSDRSDKVHNASPTQTPILRGKAASAPKLKSGKSKPAASDVTGVRESQQKEKRGSH
jgi:hypothetical protein